jgi:hypothetical protein
MITKTIKSILKTIISTIILFILEYYTTETSIFLFILSVAILFILEYYTTETINNNNTSQEPNPFYNNTIHGNNNIINNYINPNTTSPTCPQNNNEDTYESQEISINKIDNNTYTGKIDSIEEKYKKITFKSESLKQKFNFKDTKKSKYLVSVVIHKNPDNTIKYYEIIEYLGTTD